MCKYTDPPPNCRHNWMVWDGLTAFGQCCICGEILIVPSLKGNYTTKDNVNWKRLPDELIDNKINGVDCKSVEFDNCI